MVIGTTAELIKMAPVYQELKSRTITPEIWWTGMHNRGIAKRFEELNINSPSQYLGGKPDKDVESAKDATLWFFQVVKNGIFKAGKLKKLLRSNGKPIVLIHGDTFTTLIGSVLGRIWSATVMHVEAGQRSGSLKSPFPEEFNRTVAAKFTDFHFAPGPIQTKNLEKESGVVINTEVNTAIDALRMISSGDPDPEFISNQPYGVVTLHRFEFLRDEGLVTKTLTELKRISKDLRLYYFVGSHDKRILQNLGLLDEVPDTFELRDKLEFRKFIPIVKNSSVIITDSGGLALEANFLGIPALIHRQRTENPDGLGVTSMLTELDLSLFEKFIAERDRFRGPNLVDTHFPSMQIAEFIYVFQNS